MAAILVLGALAVLRYGWLPGAWFVGPWVLIGGALLPTLVGGRGSASLGLRLGSVRRTLRVLPASGMVLLGLGGGTILLFRSLGCHPPLGASGPQGDGASWILFQFAYAAFPEELFFRGYLLGHISHLVKTVWAKPPARANHVAVVLSAGVFGLSHIFVFGSPGAFLTFFPGLIFGWVFVKTDSLAGPVFLHGAANIGYGWMLRAAA